VSRFKKLALAVIGFAAQKKGKALAEGDEARMLLMAVKRFTKHAPMDTVRARRRVADRLVEAGGYPF
jgi:hypothetical protein